MTPATFASIHGGLLVRKGAAAPSVEPPKMPAAPRPGDAERYSVARRDAGDGARPAGDRAAALRPDDDDKVLKAAVRLTAGQSRQLRLAAALLDTSHQDILAEALDDHFRQLARGRLRACSCFKRAASSRPCGG